MTDIEGLTLDIFDYLMERDSDVGENVLEKYPDSQIEEKKGVIYLVARDKKMHGRVLKNYKLTIEEIKS